MKKILLFTTGGTIASKEGKNGLEPKMQAGELLSYMGDLTARYDITCEELLKLDSFQISRQRNGKPSPGPYIEIWSTMTVSL